MSARSETKVTGAGRSEPVPAHLTLDPAWGRLSVVKFGTVWDGQPDELFRPLASDERLWFMREQAQGPVVAFTLHDPHDFDPEATDDPEVWERYRFSVPLLGLADAPVGEIVLAVQGRFEPDEPTADAMFFHSAMRAEQTDGLEAAAGLWRLALEAGELKARYSLGYTLVEMGEFGEAYDHLRIYAELTPHNAWAWCWLGRACEGLGDAAEAAAAYRRAIALEGEGGFETDAPELLRALEGRE